MLPLKLMIIFFMMQYSFMYLTMCFGMSSQWVSKVWSKKEKRTNSHAWKIVKMASNKRNIIIIYYVSSEFLQSGAREVRLSENI